MKIETEVTVECGLVKKYEVDACNLTGIEDAALAVLATKQAFIMAGRHLAEKNWLAANPRPEGVTTQAAHLKLMTRESFLPSYWPSAERVLEEAKIKATKPKKTSAEALIIQRAAASMGMTVEEFEAKFGQ